MWLETDNLGTALAIAVEHEDTARRLPQLLLLIFLYDRTCERRLLLDAAPRFLEVAELRLIHARYVIIVGLI